MLRHVLKLFSLSILLCAGPAIAADRADEYAGFPRLTDNYEVGSRKQNYDTYKFPTSINKSFSVEGEKTLLEYHYKKNDINASRLQFQRHFEAIVKNLGGEVVHAGQTDDYRFAMTFKFPRKGKLVWGLASTNDANEVYYYKLAFIETTEAWGGAPAPAPVPTVAPAAAPKPAPMPEPAPMAAPEPAMPWNGGEWVEVRFGGCDVPDVRRSKQAVPDDDFCTAQLSGKVAICNADNGGCFYKNVTPKQCKDGSRPGRMFVCTPR